MFLNQTKIHQKMFENKPNIFKEVFKKIKKTKRYVHWESVTQDSYLTAYKSEQFNIIYITYSRTLINKI